MNSTGFIIFIFIVLVSLWLLLFFYVFFANRNILKSYKSLSEKYGFETDFSKKSGFYRLPVSNGYYQGTQVTIGSYVSNEGKKKSAATYIEAECTNPTQFEFMIVKRTTSNTAKYGDKETVVNDSEFNDKFIVSTNEPEKLNNLLNFSIKYKLAQSFKLGPGGELRLNGNKLHYFENELIKGSTHLLRIEIILHLLCEISDELKRI